MTLSNLQLIQPIPGNTVDQNQLLQIQKLISSLSAEQILWLSGYLAGLSPHNNTANYHQDKAQDQSVFTVLYGSQTGNGKSIAQAYFEKAKSLGLNAKLVSLADYKFKSLSKERYIALIISTHGEGEAPDDAELFYEQLFSKRAPKLDQLRYSILALGDSSYEKFCQTGKDIDQQFSKLGAKALANRIDCDLDYESLAETWQEEGLKKFNAIIETRPELISPNIVNLPTSTQTYNRQNPFSSEVLAIQKISSRDSSKEVYHLELSLEGSGLHYQPGDALGIAADNDPQLVKNIIALIAAKTNEIVIFQGRQISIKQALTEEFEITLIQKNFLKFYTRLNDDQQISGAVKNNINFKQFVKSRQLIDILQQFPAKQALTAQQLIDNLRKKTPRLYSIASSELANPNEVHLTVNLVKSAQQCPQNGLTSGLLCERLKEGEKVRSYIEHNQNFKLPPDNETAIIMIGPGTGVAPFRAFLQEREESNASGKNWLFFGNRNFEHDFLYQTEWQSLLQNKTLTKIDLAFSRDQQEKIYVQHCIDQRAKELWQWIKQGAHIYICGDAEHMAKDVETSLLKVFQKQGQLDQQQAKGFLKNLKRNKRYQKDIY